MMSEQDHWNLLASKIGAEASPTPPASAPPPQPVVPPRPAPAAKKPAAVPPRPNTDWSQLAGNLGVDVPEESPPRAAVEPASGRRPQPREASEPRRHETGSRGRGAPAERRDEPREPERFGESIREEVFASEDFPGEDFVKQEDGDAEIEATNEGGEPGGEGEAPQRKRRRRRRGGRRNRRTRPEGDESHQHTPSDVDGGESVEGQDFDERDDARSESSAEGFESLEHEGREPGSLDEGSAPSGESEDRPQRGRPKRRRRRGSGRNRDKARAADGQRSDEEPRGGGESEGHPDEDAATFAADDAGDFGEGDDDGYVAMSGDDDTNEELAVDVAGDKNSHRAIPSWDEAIGHIVGINMESRAKNPKSGPPRGRGRGRGGRGGARGGGRRP